MASECLVDLILCLRDMIRSAFDPITPAVKRVFQQADQSAYPLVVAGEVYEANDDPECDEGDSNHDGTPLCHWDLWRDKSVEDPDENERDQA